MKHLSLCKLRARAYFAFYKEHKVLTRDIRQKNILQGSIEYLEMHVDFEDVVLVAFVPISFAACDAFNNALEHYGRSTSSVQ